MKGPDRGGRGNHAGIPEHDGRGFRDRFTALLSMKREDAPEVDEAVAAIIADVRARGDAAVLELTERFDRMALTPTGSPFRRRDRRGHRAGPEEERAALELAAARIRAYHERQLPKDARWTDDTGATLGWRWSAVSAAGLYVPGGLASYPSSVLMNAIPAQVAGVERLVICAPTPDGVANPLVLLAARLSGVDTVYRIGGAQAVAAMAYGTEDDRAGGQDHRPRQRLCGGGQAAGVRQGRHRHDRGARPKSS
jgi:histidinol dehydrogenase